MSDLQMCELSGVVTVGPKGQVVIPADVREKMNIKPGDKLVALYIPHRGTVGFVPEAKIQDIINHLGSRIQELRQVVDET